MQIYKIIFDFYENQIKKIKLNRYINSTTNHSPFKPLSAQFYTNVNFYLFSYLCGF
jgi:hypothetical protein